MTSYWNTAGFNLGLGDFNISNRLFVAGDISLNQRLYVNRDVSMNGNVQIGGTLIIGASTIPQSAIIGGVGVGSSNFTTDVSMTNRLFVASDVSLNKRVVIGGDVSMNGNVQIGGLITTNGGITLPATKIFTNSGTITNTGGISGAGSIATSGGITVTGVGLTVSSGSTSLQGTTVTTLTNSSTLTNTGGISGSGAIATSGQVSGASFNATSDYRVKSEITPINTNVTVDLLNPMKYYRKDLNKYEYGFIAHEVGEIFPELVSGEKDASEYQGINYNALIPILVKEIQEMKKQLKALSKVP